MKSKRVNHENDRTQIGQRSLKVPLGNRFRDGMEGATPDASNREFFGLSMLFPTLIDMNTTQNNLVSLMKPWPTKSGVPQVHLP